MEDTSAKEQQKEQEASQTRQEPVLEKKQISQRTLLLILALAGITLFFLYLALRPQLNQQMTKQIPPTAMPTPYAQSILAFTPASTGSAQSKTYNVTVTSNANTINAVQLEMAFDPKVLSAITLTPGSFFPNPVVLIKNIDYTNGRISYALGIQPQDHGMKGQGTVATISFRVLPGVTATSTVLTFTPKTLVAAEGVTQSVLQTAQPVTIPLGQ